MLCGWCKSELCTYCCNAVHFSRTSIRCAWSGPSIGNKAPASFASELDFGVASSEGYFPYTGSKSPISILLDIFIAAGSTPA